MGKLDNKVAIVTGASSGMGEAITKLFTKEGASVVAIARRKEKLQSVIDKITSEGGKAIAVAGDVTSDDDVRNAVKTAVEKYGKLDIVVNNAGLMDKMDPAGEVSDEIWNAVINVNQTGPMRVFRAAIPEMLKNGKGAFVTIASVGGLRGGVAGAAYTSSKHGVLGLAKNVAYMYARKGIRSNIIAPGGVNTEMGSTPLDTMNQEGLRILMSPIELTNPRYGEASEIAQVALFLASDDASFVNGATVVADSGWSTY